METAGTIVCDIVMNKVLTTLDTVEPHLYAIFVMPGSYLLAWFATVAPATALTLGVTAGPPEGLAGVVLSLVCWILLIITISVVWQVFRDGLRVANAIVRTAWFRLSIAISTIKTRLLLKLRSLLAHRRAPDFSDSQTVDFDEWDMAVLDCISEQGPGFTLSAPELAARLPMRPSRIQESLEKLSRFKMLDSVIGSTDGFDNYRLTEAGATFVSVWQRQECRG